jgi:hypothetical protein
MYSIGSSRFSDIEGAVNGAFSNVKPGYMGSTESPVMTTPCMVTIALVAAAASMAMAGSTLCLAC